MFLKFRRKDGRTFLSLAESCRDGRRTIQRVVLELGPRDAMTPGDIHELATALALGDAGLRMYASRRSGTPDLVPAVQQTETPVDVGGSG